MSLLFSVQNSIVAKHLRGDEILSNDFIISELLLLNVSVNEFYNQTILNAMQLWQKLGAYLLDHILCEVDTHKKSDTDILWWLNSHSCVQMVYMVIT